jgi:TolA-binding protein
MNLLFFAVKLTFFKNTFYTGYHYQYGDNFNAYDDNDVDDNINNGGFKNMFCCFEEITEFSICTVATVVSTPTPMKQKAITSTTSPTTTTTATESTTTSSSSSTTSTSTNSTQLENNNEKPFQTLEEVEQELSKLMLDVSLLEKSMNLQKPETNDNDNNESDDDDDGWNDDDDQKRTTTTTTSSTSIVSPALSMALASAAASYTGVADDAFNDHAAHQQNTHNNNNTNDDDEDDDDDDDEHDANHHHYDDDDDDVPFYESLERIKMRQYQIYNRRYQFGYDLVSDASKFCQNDFKNVYQQLIY